MLVCWGQKYNEGSPIVRQSRGEKREKLENERMGHTCYLYFG